MKFKFFSFAKQPSFKYFIAIFGTFFIGCLFGAIIQGSLQTKNQVYQDGASSSEQEMRVFSSQQLIEEQLSSEWQNIKYKSLLRDNFSDVVLFQIEDEQGVHRHIGESHVIYILSGEGEAISNGKTFNIEKGALLYIPSGVAHNIKSKNNSLKAIQFSAPPFDINRFKWISK